MVKKIVHVARFAHPHTGGIEAVINQINESISDENFEKEVFCCSNTDKSGTENGVKYTRCKYLFDFAANSISPQLFQKMMFLKTDVIHFHMPVIQNVIIWFVLYHFGLLKYKKMIITYHGAIIGYDKFMKPFWGLYRYFYEKADIIHVLSPDIINSDDILYKNKDKCRVISFGINTENGKALRKDCLINGINVNQFAGGRKILLCMGRLVRLKGFDIAMKAVKNFDNAVLLIAGSGPEFDNYSDYIKDNNLENKILLLGNVTENKEELFSLSDIFLMPSVRTESFGIVQLEAMKYQKPVINTALGTGMNYVSLDKETGLTVEPGSVKALTDAIDMLLNNDELRLRYGKNAQQRVKKLFDLKIIKGKYRELYENV